MSFFRKRQPSQSTNNVLVAGPASQALAQTRDGAQQQQQQQQQRGPPPSQQQQPQMVQQRRGDSESPLQQQQQQYTPNNQGSTRSQTGPPKQVVPQGPGSVVQQQQPQQPQQSRQQVFPWQTVKLTAGPPVVFPRPGVVQPTALSPLPFPRYGHSLPATANAAGELYLFGGLVREAVRDDLYCINTNDLSVKLVSTIGEVPSPRVGHASALVSSVLIVWGGDTNSKAGPGEPQDDSLYLLNLVTSEWTKVTTPDPTPVGRYGHAVTMVGTKFYVFGGQADLEFLNDLWSFDLSSLRASAPTWDLVWPAPGNEPPPRRTGHVCVTHKDKIYVFGGTDGKYHYNDTWVFDVTTSIWTELTCIGFIPAAREGHAAALVDDVMYVFGGRGVDGKDLNDLAAFKISNSRWFTFTRMGEPPSGRSGHAMASVNGRVFVLGGESAFETTRDENPAIVHVLETKNIKYPDPTQPPPGAPGAKAPGRRPSAQALIDRERAMSPGSTGLSDTEDIRRQMAASPPNAGGRMANGQPAPLMQSFAVATKKGGPVRPRREGDELLGLSDSEAPMAPAVERARSPEAVRSPSQLGAARAVSPTQGVNGAPRMRNGIATANARSPSPIVERSIPPADAFHYAKTGGAASPVGGRPGSTGNVAADLVHNLRNKEGELDSMRRREAWLRATLSRAKKEGFVLLDTDPEEGQEVVEEYGSDEMKRVGEAVLKLKQERAKIQTLVVENARVASERVAEADRVRHGALQEAAFYRAKLAAYEAGAGAEVAKLERERSAELERQLAAAASERATHERRANEASDQVALQTRLREQAELRAAEALRRAEALDEAHERIRREHADLRERYDAHALTVREQSEHIVEHTSLAQQLSAENAAAHSELEELRLSRDEHIAALEQAQKALSAAAQRSDEMEAHWARARDEVARLQGEVHELRSELEQRITEAESVEARILEVENNWAKEREEADTLRALTNDSLTKLLDSHRDLRADEDRALRGHGEKLSAMEMEATSLRKMLKEAGQRVNEAQNALQEQQRRSATLEAEQSSLRAQLVSLRAQLGTALADGGRMRSELSLKESEVQDKARQAADAEMRLTLFRSYLSDSGIIVDEEDIAAKGGDHPVRVQELEAKLEERTRAYEQAMRDLDHIKRSRDDLENEAGALSSQLDRLRSSQSPGSQESGSEGRAAVAERKLAEVEQAHRERLAQMEGDYQTAVSYAKGTEKMLRRLKDELHKQRGVNADLQNELKIFRSGSPTEGSVRSRSVNGRGTPLSTEEAASLSDAQRQNQRLISENSDLSRRLEALQRELEQLRDQLAATRRDADARLSNLEEQEDEIRKLETELAQARSAGDPSVVERLTKQNDQLQRENEELTHRVGLLLEVDHATYGRARPVSGVSFRRVSGSSEEGWRPTDRPLSDYEDDLDHPPFVEPTRARS